MDLDHLASRVLRAEGRRGAHARIVFVGPLRMRQLNAQYRGINRPTDVLSFEGDEKKYVGEVVVCRSYIRNQARENGVPYAEELTRMTVHGLLHLLGYDHERARDAREMFARQERYVQKFV